MSLSANYKEGVTSQVGLITGSKYNVDKATKLIITYSASSIVSKSEATYVAFVKIGLFTSKSFSDSNAKMFTLANNFNSASGTITNDISSITGDYYIGIIIRAPYYYNKGTSCSVTSVKLTNA